jgi:prephenate dehydrogenase
VTDQASSSKISVSIVGGAGKMGLLFARILKDRVQSVRIASRDDKRAADAANSLGVDWIPFEEAYKSTIIIVSVPIDQTVSVCRLIGKKMKAGSLLIDLASVKTGITDSIAKNTPDRIEYLSLHPLFGPHVKDIKGKRCVAIAAKGGVMIGKFTKILTECGATVTKSTVEEHDNSMAAIQVLHHHALLTFSSTLNRISFDQKLTRYVTESLERTLQNLESMQENWETISAIQRRNPHAQKVREAFAVSANELVTFNEKLKTNLHRAVSSLRSP